MRFLGFILMACLIAAGCDGTTTTPNTGTNSGTDRDNTAVNERDANSGQLTPFDQSNSAADIELVAKIRAQVLEIDDLSINGRNIKIITNAGKVVLRGPVNSAAERTSIEQVAKRVAGDTNVNNQLEINND